MYTTVHFRFVCWGNNITKSGSFPFDLSCLFLGFIVKLATSEWFGLVALPSLLLPPETVLLSSTPLRVGPFSGIFLEESFLSRGRQRAAATWSVGR